jgi:hypothetical protein
MSRRKHGARGEEAPFSLDSFLDIVTNVVGVLVLVAMVTVLSAGSISTPSGTVAMTLPLPQASRVLFECAGDEVFVVDEEGNEARIVEEAKKAGSAATRQDLVSMLDGRDIGDATHRVRAEALPNGLAWVYALRPGVHGERAADLDREGGAFRRRVQGLGKGSFAYFVVHDDSFDVFGKARDLLRARGIAVGWHPVEGRSPLRLSAVGSLGKRVQ